MLLNFQCHRSENNTVDPFSPLIVFVFFLDLDTIVSVQPQIVYCTISFTSSLNRIRGLRPFAVHLQYIWEEILPDKSMQNACV